MKLVKLRCHQLTEDTLKYLHSSRLTRYVALDLVRFHLELLQPRLVFGQLISDFTQLQCNRRHALADRPLTPILLPARQELLLRLVSD